MKLNTLAFSVLDEIKMATNQPAGFFDIDTPEKFFALLERKHRDLQGTTKDTADLMLLIMGLNHLSEWIAPGYKPIKNEILQPKPTIPAEVFTWDISQEPKFKTLRLLCNHNKHIKPSIANRLTTQYGAPVNDWPSIASVGRFGDGPPTDYELDGQTILDAIDFVLNEYRSKWFNRPSQTKAPMSP